MVPSAMAFIDQHIPENPMRKLLRYKFARAATPATLEAMFWGVGISKSVLRMQHSMIFYRKFRDMFVYYCLERSHISQVACHPEIGSVTDWIGRHAPISVLNVNSVVCDNDQYIGQKQYIRRQ
eukprot:scaffold35711_cov34-Prasinocladus_malaysianus.AAC.1